MRFSFLIIVSVIGLTYSASAQTKKEPTIGRTCRIVFPERPNHSPKFAYLFDGTKSQRVHLPSMNFSPVIKLPAGELTILLTPNEITDLENPPLGGPMLKISEDIKEFYILMVPDPSNSTLPLRMKMVNVSGGKLKLGETLWFNTTDHHIVANLGKSKLSVKPKSQTVSKSPVSKSGYYRAELGYQRLAKGQFKKITEQHWWHDTKSRHVGFIVNTGGRLPKIYYYRDFR